MKLSQKIYSTLSTRMINLAGKYLHNIFSHFKLVELKWAKGT